MNGCMFFNRSYTRWQKALVFNLKQSFGVKNWCAYVYGKKPYEMIMRQEGVRYGPVLIDEILAVKAKDEVIDDEFLKEKEKEYGIPFLWQAFTSDRIMSLNWPRNFYTRYDPIFNHEEIKKQLQLRIKEIEKMFDIAKPDFVIFAAAGAMGVNLLYHIAQKRGIRCINIGQSRIDDGMAILTESIYGHLTSTEEKFEKIRAGNYRSHKREEAIQWVEAFRNRRIKPYRPGLVAQQRTSIYLVPFLKNLYGSFLSSFDNSFPKIYSYGVLVYLKRTFLTWLNMHRRQIYDRVDFKEDYAFFPLHYEPEMSLLMYAPFYTNQLYLIKNISQSLPMHFKLYVKEHPSMIGLRKPSFYKELKKIPNVKLINISTGSEHLIRNSKFVTVITSTAGWEAALLKKPVISFGPVFYNKLSMVKRCQEIEGLPNLVKECLENYTHNEEELIDLTVSLIEDSFSINLKELLDEHDYQKLTDRSEIKHLAERIMRFMEFKVSQS